MMTNKKILPIFMITIILSVSITGIIPVPHVYASSNPNLFVSAENSQFNNYFAGPQVIQVIVADPDINRLDQVYGEPTVTVNGKKLHMAQATDGNWYAFFADSKQAQIADSTQGNTGKGLDFGRFCSAASAINATGIDFTQTKGIAIAESAPGSVNGVQSPSAAVSAMCTNSTNGAITSIVTNSSLLNHVVRQSKILNPGGMGGVTRVGQITTNNPALEKAWPIIQLYDFSSLPNSVTVDYQKSGGDQIVSLTFDRIPTNLIGASLDSSSYARFSQVRVIMNDPQLNIDPTEEDSWTWGTSTTNNTLYYMAFNRNGNPDADGTVGMQNLLGNLTSFNFNHNGKLTINPVASGPWVVNFTSNGLQVLDDSSESTQSIRGIDGPITFIESSGVNTGIFRNTDGNTARFADLVTSVDAFAGSSASLKYNDVSKSITVNGSAIPAKQLILGNLALAKLQMHQDRNMDAADTLLSVNNIIQTSVADPEKTNLLTMVNNAMYSNIISATPGGVHEYPLQCQSHEIKALVTPSPIGQLAFTYSNGTGLYAPNITVNQTEDQRCLPYLVRNANVTSATFDENAHVLSINMTTPSVHTVTGQLILSIDRALLDSKDNTGTDKPFTSFSNGALQSHQENNTATIRLLTVPFPMGTNQIRITTANPPPIPVANAGPDQIVGQNTKVDLDGSASTGSGISYSWTQTSGLPVVLLFKNTAHPEFVSPNVAPGQQKFLEFSLTVTNQYGQSTDSVKIVVTNTPITVSTDKSQYMMGDTAVISGSVNPVINGTVVSLKITDPIGNVVSVGQVAVTQGSYTSQFVTGGTFKTNGIYTITAQYGEATHASTTFILGSVSGKLWRMGTSNDGSTIIQASTSLVTKDQPLSIALSFIDKDSKKIQNQNFAIKVMQNGITIYENKQALAALGDNIQTIRSLSSSEPVDIIVTLLGQGDINNPKSLIGPMNESITAHAVVPEFGPIAVLILIISFASIIIVSRYNQKIRF